MVQVDTNIIITERSAVATSADHITPREHRGDDAAERRTVGRGRGVRDHCPGGEEVDECLQDFRPDPEDQRRPALTEQASTPRCSDRSNAMSGYPGHICGVKGGRPSNINAGGRGPAVTQQYMAGGA